MWSETRTVTKTATVSLHGNTFEVDAALVAHKVEVVFDPFACDAVEIRFQGRSMGTGVPHKITRHAHPKARAESVAPPVTATGIDYLGLVAARHEAELAKAINYSQLALPEELLPRSTDSENHNDTKEVGA